MGQITIRIDDELETKIDERRGDKPKSDFYREMLISYLAAGDGKLTTTEDKVIADNSGYIKSLEEQLSLLKDQVTDLRGTNGKLMALLNQEQALHLQTQRMLPAPEIKKWWHVWK